MKIGRFNYFLGTAAIFTSCETPQGKPDYRSKSGSWYWYSPAGVIRLSNHWNCVADCRWILDSGEKSLFPEPRSAFCAWEDFTKITGAVYGL